MEMLGGNGKWEVEDKVELSEWRKGISEDFH